MIKQFLLRLIAPLVHEVLKAEESAIVGFIERAIADQNIERQVEDAIESADVDGLVTKSVRDENIEGEVEQAITDAEIDEQVERAVADEVRDLDLLELLNEVLKTKMISVNPETGVITLVERDAQEVK